MEEQFYRDVLDRLDEGVYFVDRARRITYWNQGAQRLTGFTEDEVLGRSCSQGILRHVDDAGTLLCSRACPLLAVMHDGQSRSAPVFLHHRDGHRVPVWVSGSAIRNESGIVVGCVETFHRREASRFAVAEESGVDDALTDPLTGIGNRRFGEAQLASILSVVADGYTSLGLLFIDVDHFKAVNDTYGHNTGDQVLRMVAQDIANGLGRGDYPVRWGGEEFLALLPGASDESLLAAAERIRMLVEHSWIEATTGEAPTIRVTVSIGAAMADLGESATELLDRADRMMYTSKAAGRNLVTSQSGLQPRHAAPAPGQTYSAWHSSTLRSVNVTEPQRAAR